MPTPTKAEIIAVAEDCERQAERYHQHSLACQEAGDIERAHFWADSATKRITEAQGFRELAKGCE